MKTRKRRGRPRLYDWDALDKTIERLVAKENKDSPYNDASLLAMLTADGVKATRMTIYTSRKRLGLPCAYKRRVNGG